MAIQMGAEELLDRVESALADYNPRKIDHPTRFSRGGPRPHPRPRGRAARYLHPAYEPR